MCANHSKALGVEWQIRQIWPPTAMIIEGRDGFKSINSEVSMKKYIPYRNIYQRSNVVWGFKKTSFRTKYLS